MLARVTATTAGTALAAVVPIRGTALVRVMQVVILINGNSMVPARAVVAISKP